MGNNVCGTSNKKFLKEQTLQAINRESIIEFEKTIKDLNLKIDAIIANDDRTSEKEIVKEIKMQKRYFYQIEYYRLKNVPIDRLVNMYHEFEILEAKMSAWKKFNRENETDGDLICPYVQSCDLSKTKDSHNKDLEFLKMLKVIAVFNMIFEFLEENDENMTSHQRIVQDLMLDHRIHRKEDFDNKKNEKLAEIATNLSERLNKLYILNNPKLNDIKVTLLLEMKQFRDLLNSWIIEMNEMEILQRNIHATVMQIEKLLKNPLEISRQKDSIKKKITQKGNIFKSTNILYGEMLDGDYCASAHTSSRNEYILKEAEKRMPQNTKIASVKTNGAPKLPVRCIHITDRRNIALSSPEEASSLLDQTSTNSNKDQHCNRKTVYMNYEMLDKDESSPYIYLDANRPPIPLPRNNNTVLIGNLPSYWQKLVKFNQKEKFTEEEKTEIVQTRRDVVAAALLYEKLFVELLEKCRK